MNIRWMIRQDMPEVLAIEAASFVTHSCDGGSDFIEHPWEKDEFVRVLRQRNCIGMVAECLKTEKILGFFVYELYETRFVLTDFAVHPDHRRRGVGTKMVKKLLEKLAARRRRRMELVVRDRDLSSQLFFQACGFKADEVFRNYYSNGDDAYVMSIAAVEDATIGACE